MSAAPQISPDETEQLIWTLRPIINRYNARDHRESLELLKAVRLAPSLEVCEALLRGEKVPVSRFDPDWVKAYGLG